VNDNLMAGPGAHEGSAVNALNAGRPEEAQIQAILALAAAVNRLATAHETIASANV